MAKKVISYSLEEDIIDFILKYKKDNRLSSASAALERIVLEKKHREMFLKELELEDREVLVTSLNSEKDIPEDKKEESKLKNKKLVSNIDESFSMLQGKQ